VLAVLLTAAGAAVPAGLAPASVAAADAVTPAPPAVVTGVSRVPSTFPDDDGIAIRWTWRPGVVTYQVQWARNKKFTKKKRTTTVRAASKQPARGSQSLLLTGLASATPYWIRVRAVDAQGRTGPWSTRRGATTASPVKRSAARLTVKPGKKPGTVVFRWKKGSLHPKRYVITIASSMFYPGVKGLAQRGRHQKKIVVSAKRSSYTVSARLAAKAGVAVGSGDTLYYRFAVRYAKKTKVRTQLSVGLHGTLTAPVKAPRTGTTIKVATYNVGSAMVTAKGTGVGRPWTERAAKVAKIINDSGAGIVGLQELGPGNQVDGHASLAKDPVRQTESLLAKVNKPLDRAPWRLVRTTPYVRPGAKQGTQGARILYDSSRYTLLSDCDDAVLDSCTITTPVLPTDSDSNERRAAYARFRDKKTKAEFYVVSAHLDYRRGASKAKQRAYDLLRKKQAKHVVAEVAKINTQKLPVILTGDLNGWQNDRVSGNPAHDALLAAGYYDASATTKRLGTTLLTTTSWRRAIKPTSFASRLDYIMLHGVKGSLTYVNTMVASDSKRASDHALVLAKVRLPKQKR